MRAPRAARPPPAGMLVLTTAVLLHALPAVARAGRVKNTVNATKAPHPPVSFSYGGSSWCVLGGLRHGNRPKGFTKCEGGFVAQGDNWTTATTVEGETTYADEHGLRAQVSWKHYTNATLGVATSLPCYRKLRPLA